MQPTRALVYLLASTLALAGCGDEGNDRAARERFDQAVADQDPVRARAAAAELGQELPDTPESVLEVARLLADIGEMNQARWMLREARERFPERTELVLGLAETSLRVGDAEGALSALEGFPPEAEKSAYAEVLRARARIQLGQLEEGLAMLERGHERYDEPVLFRLERIDVLASEHRPGEALVTVHEMQADPAVPKPVRIWLAIKASDLVARSEGPEAALALLDTLWAEDASSADVATRRTSLLVTAGRAPEALADLRAALESHPQAVALYAIAAQAAIASGDIAGAEALLREQLELDANATSLSNLALFLNRLGRPSEAAELLADLPEIEDPVQRLELRYLAIALRIEAGDIAQARESVETFGREHPRNPRFGYLRARLDLAEGNAKAAAARLTDVLTRLDRPDVKHLLGVALERLGDQAGAELRYGLAAQENPQQLPSWLGLLRTLEAQGKWERAAAVAVRVIRIAPVGAFAYQALANAKIALGRPEEAEALLREYLARNPGRHGPRAALSLALRRQGRAAEALATLDEAGPEEQASDPNLVAERAVVLGRLGRVSEGFQWLDTAPGAESPTRALRHARIYLLFAAGQAEEALAEAERAAASDAPDPVPHRMTADYLASRGRFAEAVEPYRRALARASDANVAFRLGIALEGCDRDGEAIDAYRQAIEIDDKAVAPRNNLALALARAGIMQEALEMAQSAYARAELDPVVMDTLASLYLASGLAPRAAALLEKARRADSESSEIAYHLALAYRETQRPDEARALLADLDAQLDPEHALREPVDAALASLR
jgi:tetratricopeptide (TPR) repeat protein